MFMLKITSTKKIISYLTDFTTPHLPLYTGDSQGNLCTGLFFTLNINYVKTLCKLLHDVQKLSPFFIFPS